jgi:HAMP domain-containing protein
MQIDILAFLVFCAQKFVPFLKDYQTLIGAGIALVAAWVAARPVWRQLLQMNVETNSIFREFLAGKIRSTTARQAWLRGLLQGYEIPTLSRIYEVEEFGLGEFDAHWAFDRDQEAERLLDKLRTYQRERRDPEGIRTELATVVIRLEALQTTLDDIHRPEHTDQHDEDRSISDDDWAALLQRGTDAKTEISGLASSFSRATRRLEASFEAELASLRDRLQTVENALLDHPAKPKLLRLSSRQQKS